jgi:hypothetical protein
MLLPSFGHAQSGVGMSPPRAELQATPGARLTQAVLVDNPSGVAALEVTTTLNDVLLQPDGTMLYLPPGSHETSLSDWLAVNPLNFVLGAGETQEVTYTVQVPDDAQDGTYWTILFFESQVPGGAEPAQGIGIQTRVRVGHVAYVDVGQVSRSGEIEGFRYQPAGANPADTVQIMFRNTGNGLVRAEGHLELRSTSGELVHALEIPATATFPGYASEIQALLPAPLESGEYLVLAVLDYGQASVVTGEGWLEVP